MITLRCPRCRLERPVERDEFDPPTATVAEIICPKCDDGDRHSPEFFDAEGKWVSPELGIPQPEAPHHSKESPNV